MSGLSLDGVSVVIDGQQILCAVSMEVSPAEVVAVLGPSGSGKSTLLRAVAGFVPSDGTIRLGGVDLGDLPTHRRGIGLMFQSDALFPHLSVADNVMFGLEEAGVPRAVARERVMGLLSMVGLGALAERAVSGLSGGESQRVALIRALAPEPALLMLDEPLGSLDRRLRDELAIELAELLRRTNTTSLYVTHDQEEAAVVADRLLILEEGRVVATGDAETLWSRPPTPWVAKFLGHSNVGPAGVVPVSAVSIGSPDHGTAATVRVSRFVDGAWRLRLQLPEPLLGMTELVARSRLRYDVATRVGIEIDHSAVHSFNGQD